MKVLLLWDAPRIKDEIPARAAFTEKRNKKSHAEKSLLFLFFFLGPRVFFSPASQIVFLFPLHWVLVRDLGRTQPTFLCMLMRTDCSHFFSGSNCSV